MAKKGGEIWWHACNTGWDKCRELIWPSYFLIHTITSPCCVRPRARSQKQQWDVSSFVGVINSTRPSLCGAHVPKLSLLRTRLETREERAMNLWQLPLTLSLLCCSSAVAVGAATMQQGGPKACLYITQVVKNHFLKEKELPYSVLMGTGYGHLCFHAVGPLPSIEASLLWCGRERQKKFWQH